MHVLKMLISQLMSNRFYFPADCVVVKLPKRLFARYVYKIRNGNDINHNGIIVITMRVMMQAPSCAVISNIAHRNEAQIARASKTECAAAAVSSSRL